MNRQTTRSVSVRLTCVPTRVHVSRLKRSRRRLSDKHGACQSWCRVSTTYELVPTFERDNTERSVPALTRDYTIQLINIVATSTRVHTHHTWSVRCTRLVEVHHIQELFATFIYSVHT